MSGKHRTFLCPSLHSSQLRKWGVAWLPQGPWKRVSFFLYLLQHKTCGILVPQPEIEPVPPALEAQSLNHWTARKVQGEDFLSSTPGFWMPPQLLCGHHFPPLQALLDDSPLQLRALLYCPQEFRLGRNECILMRTDRWSGVLEQ